MAPGLQNVSVVLQRRRDMTAFLPIYKYPHTAREDGKT